MVTYFNSSLQSSLIGSLADIVLYNILTSVTNLSIGWEHRRGYGHHQSRTTGTTDLTSQDFSSFSIVTEFVLLPI